MRAVVFVCRVPDQTSFSEVRRLSYQITSCGKIREAPNPNSLSQQHRAPILVPDPEHCPSSAGQQMRALDTPHFVPRDRKANVLQEEPEQMRNQRNVQAGLSQEMGITLAHLHTWQQCHNAT